MGEGKKKRLGGKKLTLKRPDLHHIAENTTITTLHQPENLKITAGGRSMGEKGTAQRNSRKNLSKRKVSNR